MKPLSWVGRSLPNGLSVLEEIGATSDGTLYRARTQTGQEVGLLIPAKQSASHSLFQQATRIRHLNVAAVHEIGEIPGGSAYVVLELVSGEPLSDLLARHGAIPLQEAGELFLQAAAGVQAAHDVGLVHADLSPESLLVTRTHSGPLVKLIRFAPLSSSSPTVGIALDHSGSAAYASPERLAGHTPDARSDIYSLGAVLHHMLVGSPPGMSSCIPESAAIRGVISRAMQPIPEQRYQQVPELVRATKLAVARAAAADRPRSRRPLYVTAAGLVALLAGGMWLGATTPSRARVPAKPVQRPERAVEPAAGSDAAPDSLAIAAEVATDTLPLAREAAAAPLGEPLTESEVVATDTRIDAYEPTESIDTGVTGSAEMDTGAISLPESAPAFVTPDERAGIDQRIGLDEAKQVLGGPPHAIEGMLPMFMGLARERFPEGADPSRLLVRTVYLDRNGGVILLDQQKIVADSAVEDEPGKRWVIGDVMLYLHGDSNPANLANLAKRVR